MTDDDHIGGRLDLWFVGKRLVASADVVRWFGRPSRRYNPMVSTSTTYNPGDGDESIFDFKGSMNNRPVFVLWKGSKNRVQSSLT
jgi:hypothetical protein